MYVSDPPIHNSYIPVPDLPPPHASPTATFLAFTRRRLAGGLLLEAVVASLTAAQRSASSLTNTGGAPSNLDAAVDKVLAEVFAGDMADFEEQPAGAGQ